jgi:hypothetical protein
VADSCGNFVEKNSDTLFQDLKRLLFNCGLDALKTMFPEGADEVGAGALGSMRIGTALQLLVGDFANS